MPKYTEPQDRYRKPRSRGKTIRHAQNALDNAEKKLKHYESRRAKGFAYNFMVNWYRKEVDTLRAAIRDMEAKRVL